MNVFHIYQHNITCVIEQYKITVIIIKTLETSKSGARIRHGKKMRVKGSREDRTKEKGKRIAGYEFYFKINIKLKFRLDFSISGHRHVAGCCKMYNEVSFHQILRMFLLCSVTGSVSRWTSLKKKF